MNLNQLLKQENIKVKDLAQLLINTVNNTNKRETATTEQINRLESKLKTPQERTEYIIYFDMYKNIVTQFNMCQAHIQQVYGAYQYNVKTAIELNRANYTRQQINQTPLILTKNDFDLCFNDVKKKKAAKKESINSIINNIVKALINNAIIPKELESIAKDLKALEKEELPNEAFLLLDNKGYYELPDGRTSDQMSADDWNKAIKELCIITGKPDREQREYYFLKLFFEGAAAVKKAYKTETGKPLKADDKAIMTAIDRLISATGFYSALARDLDKKLCGGNIADWRPYTTANINFLAYINILLGENDLEYLLQMYKSDKNPQKNKINLLYIKLQDYIKSKIPAAIKIKDNKKPFITSGTLEKKAIFGYEGVTTPQDIDIIKEYKSKNKQIIRDFEGVAVLNSITKYKAIDPLSRLESAEKILKSKFKAERLNEYSNRIYLSIRFIKAFNEVMGMIQTIYKIDTTGTLTDVNDLMDKLKMYNESIYIMYWSAEPKNRQDIKKLFNPIKLEQTLFNKVDIQNVFNDFKTRALLPPTDPNYKPLGYYIYALLN